MLLFKWHLNVNRELLFDFLMIQREHSHFHDSSQLLKSSFLVFYLSETNQSSEPELQWFCGTMYNVALVNSTYESVQLAGSTTKTTGHN